MSAEKPTQNEQATNPSPPAVQAPQPPAQAAEEALPNLRKVPLDGRNKLRFLSYYLLGTLILMFGLSLGLVHESGQIPESLKWRTFDSVVLVPLGAFMLWCAKARYLGGFRSFLGASIAATGVICLLAGLWDSLQARRMEGGGIIAGLFLLFIGSALVYLGHHIHKDRWKNLLLKSKAASDLKTRLELQLAAIKKTDHYRAEAYFWLGILLTFGSLSLGAGLAADGWKVFIPFLPLLLGGLIMGVLCIRWYYRQYRGGMATLTGILLLFAGLAILAAAWISIANHHTNALALAAAFGLVVGGGMVLWDGHHLHHRRTQFLNEEVLAPLNAMKSGASLPSRTTGACGAARPTTTSVSSRPRQCYRIVHLVFSIAFLLGGLLLGVGIILAGYGKPLMISCPLVMLVAGGLLAYWAVHHQAGSGIILVGLLWSAIGVAVMGTTLELLLQNHNGDDALLFFAGSIGVVILVFGLLLLSAGYELHSPVAETGAGETPPIRWADRWRPFGKYLGIGAGIVGLIYLIENARGYYAWKALRQELIAAGEHLNWKDFIPPPVPDEQNFAAAPIFRQWPLATTGWVSGKPELLPHPSFPAVSGTPYSIEAIKTAVQHAAEMVSNKVDLRLVKTAAPFDEQTTITFLDCSLDVVLKNLSEQGGLKVVITGVAGLNNEHIINFKRENVTPRAVLLDLVEQCKLVAYHKPGEEVIHIEPQSYIITLDDLLAWYKPYETNLAALHAAATRPKARIEDSYTFDILTTIPSFVRCRIAAQSLATHANASLLAGKPDTALQDLQVIEQIAFASKSHPTLVGAMISVALRGLSASLVEEGLAEGVWREPQMAALQQTLARPDLPAVVIFGLEAERTAICTTIQSLSRKQLGGRLEDHLVTLPKAWGQRPSWNRIVLARCYQILLQIVPRGWLYQNQCAIARHFHQQLQPVELSKNVDANQLILPYLDTVPSRAWCPYQFLAVWWTPPYARARLTAARNQAGLDLARVACALERYRLAQGEYPKTLNDLVPRFALTIPIDLMNGQPLHYRPTPNGKYLLYSVGDNHQDDGGVGGTNRYSPDAKDWVWRGVPK